MDNNEFDSSVLYVAGVNYFEKDWGYEFWFANNDKYCGKTIYIEYEKFSSHGNFHYHREKDETFFVISGVLGIDFFDEETEVFNSVTLHAGQSIRIAPNTKHRFTAFSPEGSEFIEVSTHHDEKDSYRVKWDANKKEWQVYDKEELLS